MKLLHTCDKEIATYHNKSLTTKALENTCLKPVFISIPQFYLYKAINAHETFQIKSFLDLSLTN